MPTPYVKCPWTCGPSSDLSCDYIIQHADTAAVTCEALESQRGCNCGGCNCLAPTTPFATPPTTTRPGPPGSHWQNYYHNSYYYFYYSEYGYLQSGDSNSMLWIIVGVAIVFVVATSILGAVVYRRRQAMRRARLANRRRAVTEIELEEAERLPYVERVEDDPGTSVYPVAEPLRVVNSRSPSRSPSLNYIRTYMSNEVGSLGNVIDQDPQVSSSATTDAGESDHALRRHDADTLPSSTDAPLYPGQYVHDSDSDDSTPNVPPLPRQRDDSDTAMEIDLVSDSGDDDDDDDDDLQLARALSLSMSAMPVDGGDSNGMLCGGGVHDDMPNDLIDPENLRVDVDSNSDDVIQLDSDDDSEQTADLAASDDDDASK